MVAVRARYHRGSLWASAVQSDRGEGLMYQFIIIYQDSFAVESYFGSSQDAEVQFDHLIRMRQSARQIYFYGPEGLINDWSIERK